MPRKNRLFTVCGARVWLRIHAGEDSIIAFDRDDATPEHTTGGACLACREGTRHTERYHQMALKGVYGNVN